MLQLSAFVFQIPAKRLAGAPMTAAGSVVGGGSGSCEPCINLKQV